MSKQKLLAVLAAMALAAIATAAPAEAGAPKKFRATRAFVVDRQTGAVRLPTPAEVDAVVTTLTALGPKPAETLAAATSPTGAVAIDLAGGFAGVLLARPAEDGRWETRCVFTIEEGADFLGLVEDVL